MPLSEHMYCVVIAFRITEQVEQWICIKFCVKFEHSCAETIRVIQKATALGNRRLAASARQYARSCIMSCAEFFAKHARLQPRFGVLWLLAFPQIKITFEREEISDHQWDSGKYDRAADDDWENCEVPKCLLWRGLRNHCPMYNVSCVSYLLQWMFIFHIKRLDTFQTELNVYIFLTVVSIWFWNHRRAWGCFSTQQQRTRWFDSDVCQIFSTSA